jgi:glycosyltransferase involved in cell wall biosynthesis
VDGTVLHALGNRFLGSPLPRAGGRLGRTTCALINFEDPVLPNAANICGDFRLMITPSRWNEQVLRDQGVTNVATVIQGVDPSVFHPGPRSGVLEGRFAVFSGGKLEHRKAQDLVLLAFRAFAQRHAEALLVTCWHSPWPAIAQTLNSNPDVAPVGFGADGKLDTVGWATANGLRPEQFMALDMMPNHQIGRTLREMDVAVFPNRCEGGTNLVAMECMACGLPCIISNNTGHVELIATGGTLPLLRQGPLPHRSAHTEGWAESDVDEIVEALEYVWANREAAQQRGAAAAQAMAGWSWRQQIGHLAQVLEPL